MSEKGKSNAKVMPIVRKPHFNWEGMPLHYVENNYFGTHFLNSMHVVFPEGEKYFIRSVKAFADKIEDPNLKERVKAFIGQEAQHMALHKTFWQKLQDEGPALDIFEKIYSATAFDFLEKFSRALSRDKYSLSVTAALEHYTAILAEVVFKDDCEMLDGISEEMVKMLKWHAAEEIEHKAVAFDVLKTVDDSYLLRVSGMVFATYGLVFYILMGQAIFMAFDKQIPFWDLTGQFLRFAEKATPIFTAVAKEVADYFRPDFHPDDKDNTYIAKEYFAKVEEELKAAV